MKRSEDISLKEYQEMASKRGMKHLLYLKENGETVTDLGTEKE
jgi:hypothetical protein